MRSLLWTRALLGCLLIVTAAISVSVAQPPDGQGRRGRGGGFGGGFGGRGGQTGMLPILQMDEVRTELKVGDAEKTKLDALNTERQEAQQAIFAAAGIERGGRGRGGAGGFQPPTAEEQAKQAEANKKVAEKTRELENKVADILDPNQMKRLVGLVIQRDGARSLLVNAVAEAVGVTAEQKPKIAEADEKGTKMVSDKQQELFAGGDFQGLQQAMADLRTQADKMITDVLTADQKKKMEDLKGAAFEFPQIGRGGGRGFGGAGAGDGAGGGRRGGRRGQGN